MKSKQFVPYTLALKLKELGFCESCFGYWRNEDLPNPLTLGQYTTKEDMEYEISGQDEYHNFKNIIALAPLWQQAFEWFREKHGLFHNIDTSVSRDISYSIYLNEQEIVADSCYWNYEQAQEACLTNLIKIVQDGNL